MNYFTFSTGGDWDSTFFYRNGVEYPAVRLYLGMNAGRDDYGNPARGGVELGGQMSALVAPQDGSGEQAIFPGRIELKFPNHTVAIVNETPNFIFEMTRVFLDGDDLSDQVLDLEIEIDAAQNVASAYLTLFKPHFFGADEVATFNLLP